MEAKRGDTIGPLTVVPSSPIQSSTTGVDVTLSKQVGAGSIYITLATTAGTFNPLFYNKNELVLYHNEETDEYRGEEGITTFYVKHIEGNTYRVIDEGSLGIYALITGADINGVREDITYEGIDTIECEPVDPKAYTDSKEGYITATPKSSAFDNALLAKCYIYVNGVKSTERSLTSNNTAVRVEVNAQETCYDVYVTKAAGVNVYAMLKVGNTTYYEVDLDEGE